MNRNLSPCFSFTEHGADVNAVNAAGCSPLHDAVGRGNHEITSCLLRYGADPALQITQG